MFDKKTAPALIEALNDSTAKIRCLALQGLLHLKATDAVPAIESLAQTKKDPQVLDKLQLVLPALKSGPRKRHSR